MQVDELILRYRQLRDLKKEKEEAHKAELAPLNSLMKQIEDRLRAQMHEMGVQNFKTNNGTAYISTRTSATVADWQMALDFIKVHDMWNLLEQRVSKTAVAEYKEANNDLPPGIDWREEITVNVRAA